MNLLDSLTKTLGKASKQSIRAVKKLVPCPIDDHQTMGISEPEKKDIQKNILNLIGKIR